MNKQPATTGTTAPPVASSPLPKITEPVYEPSQREHARRTSHTVRQRSVVWADPTWADRLDGRYRPGEWVTWGTAASRAQPERRDEHSDAATDEPAGARP